MHCITKYKFIIASLFKPALIVLVCTLLVCLQSAAQNQYPLVRTPQQVAINRTLPKTALAPNEPLTAVFSKEPTDKEIFGVHFFEEPLVPTEGKYNAEENQGLVLALAAFTQRRNPDDFSAITNFLKQYPKSRWQGALLANMGIVYRFSGYYNKAMDAWQKSWDLMKNEKDHKVKVLADRVMSELLLINCWVGRREKIESLLSEIDKRVMEGPATERVELARTALFIMKKRTGIAFKCGPYALNRIYRLKDSIKPFNEELMKTQSPPSGFSLAQLKALASTVGLHYQMAFRKPGAAIIDSAVVHWKLDHYSAILRNDNGKIMCEDPTMGTVYGQQFWLTPSALDSSASGYFLVPDGPLPKGWRKVSDAEGSRIFGKGVEPPDKKHLSCGDKQSDDACLSCNSSSNGMARCNVHLAAISLHIFDKPFFYAVPKGPSASWQLDYHQRDDYQPANFNYSNFGPQWTFYWLSYVQDQPMQSADVYLMGGGVRTFVTYNPLTKSYDPELQSNDVLTRVDTFCYELRHPDGSKEIYSRPGINTSRAKIFLTYIIDVAGDTLSISYDNNLRIVALKDALGQVTTVKYENADIYKITEVTAMGKSARFEYDGSGRLQKITDMIGMVSSFQYNAGSFITQMTTPYGTTSFTKKDDPDNDNLHSIEITYPLGAKERVEFRDEAPGIPKNETVVPGGMYNGLTYLFNDWMNYRNTFYWDKKAMLEAPGDYTRARIYHWLHGSPDTDEKDNIAPILESVKEPLENRVWYLYQGQTWGGGANQGMSSSPSIIGRVLEDGTTQLKQAGYNSFGADTFSLDPSNRRTSYKYDSTNIHLLEIRQTTGGVSELQAKYTYDSEHPNLPKTSTDAAGQKTTYTYTSAGQVRTITNAKNETTTFDYDGSGYLTRITGPVAGSTVSFTYDGFGRVRTVTDPEGYTITTDYDLLDRPTVITYPDSSYEQIVYDKLDAVHMRDRLGRWSHNIYDSLGRLNAVTDALGRITQFIWCACGNLSEIVDPLKQVTTFTYDIQSRLVSKIYDDNKIITYSYDTSGRLKQVIDAKGQKTNYAYFIDDNLKQVGYTNAVVATAPVSFSYDSKYNRITGMKDGSGNTAYTYYPVNKNPVLGAGRLQKVNGPLANDDIVYTYDSLGRITSRSINNMVASVIYDALGRSTSITNALGTFGYTYVNTTNRLLSVTNPNSTTTNFTYFDNAGDQRLKEIWNKAGSTTLSKFNYEYNKEGQITKWTQQTNTSRYYEIGYDVADQLTSATQKNVSNNALVKRYAYQYDKAGNRTSEQIDNSVTSALYNSLNQITTQQSGGPIRFKGNVNEFSTIAVINSNTGDTTYAAVDSATNTFEAFAKMQAGQNNIKISAKDFSGNNNTTINSYSLTVAAGTTNSVSFDANGNMTAANNPAVSYDWDAADRLVKITQGANVTEFVYDGLSRRVAEKLNGTIIKQWVWDGTALAEERDASGSTVTKRFFPQGEQIGSTNYYFTRDHLGSVRELVNSSGSIVTRYDYDPYGRRTKLSGTVDADFGFTGHYYHSTSGLYLALYRAYDPALGRWLNRDPIEDIIQFQSKGYSIGSIYTASKEAYSILNVYEYSNNNSINKIDLSGLFSSIPPGDIPKKVYGDAWYWGIFPLARISNGFGDGVWLNCVRGCLIERWDKCSEKYKPDFFVAHEVCFTRCALFGDQPISKTAETILEVGARAINAGLTFILFKRIVLGTF